MENEQKILHSLKESNCELENLMKITGLSKFEAVNGIRNLILYSYIEFGPCYDKLIKQI
ncbi:hypothetical protein KQY27_01630 [Methanobrevibacter sp. TMH8]|uniref:hypothetical protein n=1 Tax=Methanobrevibacter sp. TMH8 TaxID=2848611 RepID=UPI001CCA2354|nr:hypothetical protein [Methanobrevibacter sp. TMH8]MBZ9570247.1 hypothetical protein [Methanobrevibacter sp. TMH8]